MGRAAILSKASTSVKVIYTEKYVSYIIPIDDKTGCFHSVEATNGTAVVKFFPARDPKTIFAIKPGGTVEFF